MCDIYRKKRGHDALLICACGAIFSGAGLDAVLDSNDRPVKEERLLLDLDERIRDVIESPEGWLYVSTDSGRILCIKPASE